MKTPIEWNKIYLGDASELLEMLVKDSVDLVLTDPPYFLDKLDNGWDPKEVKVHTQNQLIKHLPAGMKFDPSQGRELQLWYGAISKKIFDSLKPGGFFLSFSSPRLVHRMAIAIEDAGFHIRDIFIWLYKEGRPKAASLERYVDKEDRPKLAGWKTPQVRGNYEPIIVAQKPPEGPLVRNFLKHQVGLFNFTEKLEGGYTPSNVLQVEELEGIPPIFLVPKPKVGEKGEWNDHPTVKPVNLLRFLIRLTTKKGGLVLDPFIGTGSTAIAATLEKRHFIGFEINAHYYEIAQKRLALVNREKGRGGEKESSLLPLLPLLADQT
ncbi:Csp231I DNA methyltransferase (plasmid) [Thermus sp. CCB_US3_UF1]|uniref:DNA-methyltransferase n=1 Tax=Thermus sp. CCB_US3_UF1 TaxID=1111069 RepID=UPI00023893FF|nr:site-specific DNA-methyltransferase [Thermus sp. CCB_US3_UF1]AEV17315.1 Csp231I DNA methyltransferase [Thermus sp. CCB_US3_UF1]